MKYNLKEIMEYAWAWFKNDDVEMDQIEYADYTMKKTFANCLKVSWKRAKEMAKYEEELVEIVSKSEELKAYKWAERKLGVTIDKTDEVKFRDVANILDNSGNCISIYQAAMRALKLTITLNKVA